MFVLVNPKTKQIEFLVRYDSLVEIKEKRAAMGYQPHQLEIHLFEDFKRGPKWGELDCIQKDMVNNNIFHKNQGKRR